MLPTSPSCEWEDRTHREDTRAQDRAPCDLANACLILLGFAWKTRGLQNRAKGTLRDLRGHRGGCGVTGVTDTEREELEEREFPAVTSAAERSSSADEHRPIGQGRSKPYIGDKRDKSHFSVEVWEEKQDGSRRKGEWKAKHGV